MNKDIERLNKMLGHLATIDNAICDLGLSDNGNLSEIERVLMGRALQDIRIIFDRIKREYQELKTADTPKAAEQVLDDLYLPF